MNLLLNEIRDKFIEQIQRYEIVLGAWKFGSETHDLSDDYSDVDIVLLIEGAAFNTSSDKIEKCINNICDEILLCYPESFNGEEIINNGYLISCKGKIFQFDVFLLNSAKLNGYICKLHYIGLTERDVIFDKSGMVKELIALNLQGNYWNDDIIGLQRTYWYHAYMTEKYLIRKDFFKLYNVMHTMYEVHVSMLLIGFDNIKWGGDANKLHFIPEDKQQHLKQYYCSEDFDKNIDNVIYSIKTFNEDTKEVCALKGFNYSSTLALNVINYLEDKSFYYFGV